MDIAHFSCAFVAGLQVGDHDPVNDLVHDGPVVTHWVAIVVGCALVDLFLHGSVHFRSKQSDNKVREKTVVFLTLDLEELRTLKLQFGQLRTGLTALCLHLYSCITTVVVVPLENKWVLGYDSVLPPQPRRG